MLTTTTDRPTLLWFKAVPDWETDEDGIATSATAQAVLSPHRLTDYMVEAEDSVPAHRLWEFKFMTPRITLHSVRQMFAHFHDEHELGVGLASEHLVRQENETFDRIANTPLR